jgi:two-component system chemotaxis response regulator CheB
VAKPGDAKDGLVVLAEEIGEKIRAAARAQIRRYVPPTPSAPVLKSAAPSGLVHDSIIAIGASTGGTEAIKDVLVRMPRNSPPIVITQHMPAGFTASYAARLNGLCEVDVKEAEEGERLLSGRAYVAPGHSHLLVVKKNGTAYTALDGGERVNRHRPSVDVLFRSVARAYGSKISAAILTGMGRDGAIGMNEIKIAGGHTVAQDEQSCVVFGMPKAAIEVGGVDEVLPLDRIASALSRRSTTPSGYLTAR